jgi:HEAT repeat protein
MERTLSILTALVLLSWSVAAVRAQPPSDESLLSAAKIPPTGEGVLAYFRGRSLDRDHQRQVEGFLRDLSNPRYDVRERASAGLVEIGTAALPALRNCLQDSDPESLRRAEACITQIERSPRAHAGLPLAAARVMAKHNPPGGIEALVDFLAFNEDEWVEEEILTALSEMAKSTRRLDRVVFEYLKDSHAVRRGAGALVVGRSPDAQTREAARRLLHDPEPKVRLRAAQGLLAGRDKRAVPALIDLIGEAPLAIANRAEDLLLRTAGDAAPLLSSSTSIASQRRSQQSWRDWWRDHADRLDLGPGEEGGRTLGLTLLAEMDTNQVTEFNADGTVSFRLLGKGANAIKGPVDAQYVRGGHVLIAEYEGSRVTERDLKGNIVWSVTVPGSPIACQRLNNGNTFVATHNTLLEYDPAGTEVYKHTPPKSVFLYHAQKLANGNVVYISNPGIIEEIDPARDRVVRTVRLGDDFGGWCSVEVLPNGRFLIALFTSSKVQELDASGKILWQCSVKAPIHATRLPNGHTLATSMLEHKIVELDEKGQVVSEKATDGRPWRVHYR